MSTSSTRRHQTSSPRHRVLGAGFGKSYGRSTCYARDSLLTYRYVNRRTHCIMK